MDPHSILSLISNLYDQIQSLQVVNQQLLEANRKQAADLQQAQAQAQPPAPDQPAPDPAIGVAAAEPGQPMAEPLPAE